MLTPHDLNPEDRALLLRLIAAAKPCVEGTDPYNNILAATVTGEPQPAWRVTAFAAWLLRYAMGVYLSIGRDGTDSPADVDAIVGQARQAIAEELRSGDPASAFRAKHATQALHLAALAGVVDLDGLQEAARAWAERDDIASYGSWYVTDAALSLLQWLTAAAGGTTLLDALAAQLLEPDLAGMSDGTAESE